MLTYVCSGLPFYLNEKIFYSIVVTAGSFHVHTIVGLPENVPVLLTFSILMLAFAALSVMTSVVLIVGLCTNNRMMLLPWIVSITMTTILDVILSFYLVTDSEIDPFFGILVATDYFICALNVYCILCVTSQYQEYVNGRGGPRQIADPEAPPVIHLEAASTVRPNQSPARMVSISIIRNDGSPTSSVCRPLISSGGSPVGRSAASSNLITSSSPVLMLSRSSFSSTSEISFYSSDLLSNSRRSSALPGQDVPKQGLSPVGEVNPFPSPSVEAAEVINEAEMSEAKSETNEEREYIRTPPAISRFRVAGVFSSIKSLPKLSKIEISEEESQSEENAQENEASHTPRTEE